MVDSGKVTLFFGFMLLLHGRITHNILSIHKFM